MYRLSSNMPNSVPRLSEPRMTRLSSTFWMRKHSHLPRISSARGSLPAAISASAMGLQPRVAHSTWGVSADCTSSGRAPETLSISAMTFFATRSTPAWAVSSTRKGSAEPFFVRNINIPPFVSSVHRAGQDEHRRAGGIEQAEGHEPGILRAGAKAGADVLPHARQ